MFLVHLGLGIFLRRKNDTLRWLCHRRICPSHRSCMMPFLFDLGISLFRKENSILRSGMTRREIAQLRTRHRGDLRDLEGRNCRCDAINNDAAVVAGATAAAVPGSPARRDKIAPFVAVDMQAATLRQTRAADALCCRRSRVAAARSIF